MSLHRKIIAGAPLAAVAMLMGTVLIAWSALRPEAALRRSFEAALAQERPEADAVVGQSTPLDRAHLWLSRAEGHPLGFAGPMRVGDRIEISGRDGPRRRLEVVDVRAVAVDGQSVEGHGPQLLMVSCRELGAGEKGLVRFVIEAEGVAPEAGKASTQRTL